MARVSNGATLPYLQAKGGHADVGAAIGHAFRGAIQETVRSALLQLHQDGLGEDALHERMAPAIDAAERWTPRLVTELRARADAAQVSFDALAYLSAGGLPPERPDRHGCTSLASRTAGGGVLLGHNEDALVPNPQELFVLDAAVTPPGAGEHRFLALCYVQALPGCSAAMNHHGLALLMDWLPDPDARIGLPFDYLSRALLELPSIEAALDFLERTPRGGGGNCLLAHGDRIVNVELTSTRMAVVDASDLGFHAHTNHFLDPRLATLAGEPQADSLPRLARARELGGRDLTPATLKALLSDRRNAPDSICRERTLGAFLAHTTQGFVEVCWGEPASATWTRHTLFLPTREIPSP
ncbi:hypothetical protein G4177_11960 [Corallococcus sp. ZKHCc1 1396]|uniref:Peptidase C45 hydrolase domain-containing protein n=1 Tax=Corallococcus soli TaxID=2710757 RepID=A0ABR9PLR7_9BACT|nr:C45 family peptidase [Corallococcus soli]MBE4748876.1 hypothetical protein [Corallococcus soli]